jgi:23S rRNA pseudouridine1911/1915/1917 synthase
MDASSRPQAEQGGFVRRLFAAADAEAGLRADVFLCLKAPFLSRAHVKRIIQTGDALVNGHRLASSTRMRTGNVLEVRWRPSDDTTADPQLRILYEDEHLLAVDKPAGTPVHPVGRKQAGSLIQAVRARMREEIAARLARGDATFYPGLVNRLDLFSSGVVLIGKDRATLAALHRAIGAGRIRKRYLAVVRGHVEPPRGVIDLAIGSDESSAVRIKRAVRADGLRAVTEYETREALRGATLLAAWPRTGRQHQIRVHFASLGHPVWGDLIYDEEALFLRYCANGCRLESSLPPRHALHCRSMELEHPDDGRLIEITAPVPDDFARIVASLR